MFGQTPESENTLVQIYDRFGNQYSPKDISYNPLTKIDGIYEFSGDGIHFVLEIVDDYPEEAIDVIEEVLYDLSVLLKVTPLSCDNDVNQDTPPELRIQLKALNIPLGSGVPAASASSFYYNFSNEGNTLPGIMYGNVWKVINSGVDPTSFPLITSIIDKTNHGNLNVNFHESINWNYDLNNTSPNSSTNTDFYQVILHEMLHMLGIASFIDSDGSSLYSSNVIAGEASLYSPFDLFLVDNNGNLNLVEVLDGCYAATFESSASILTTGCGGVSFVGNGLSLPIYAPSNWGGGSSLSHFENACGGWHFVMNPAVQNNVNNAPIRVPTPEEVKVLCALGYETTGEYGNQTYNSDYQCGQNTSAAAGDEGIYNAENQTCDHRYKVPQCETLEIFYADILANDVNVSDFGTYDPCFEVVKGDGGIIENSNSITFQLGNLDLNVIRYIPHNNGEKTNMEFIYIEVSPCLDHCPEEFINGCDLVCNNAVYTEDNCQAPNIEGNPDNISSHQLSNACNVEGWYVSNGSPDYWQFEAPKVIDGAIFIDETWNANPPNEGFIGMRVTEIDDGEDFSGEVVFTPTFPIVGQEYVFSSFINLSHLTWGNGDFTGDLEDFRVLLTNNTDWDAAGESGNFPEFSQVIVEGVSKENLEKGDVWLQVVSCFTAEQHPSVGHEYNSLYFVGVNRNAKTYLLLDQVELIEREYLEDQNLTIAECDECITIGKEICGSISNMEYQWRNVNTGEILELDGNQTPLDGTESQIVVCPKIPTQYELTRRIVPSANGLRLLGGCSNFSNEKVNIMVNTPEDCCPTPLDLDFNFNPDESIFCFGDFPNITPNIVGGVFSTSNASFELIDESTGEVSFKGVVGEHEICYSVVNEFEECVDFICKTITVEEECCLEDLPAEESVACCLEDTENLINQDFTVSTSPPNTLSVWGPNDNELIDAFPQLVSPGDVIKMNGTLYIPNGANLTMGDMKFQFGPKGKIVVERGGRLRILSSTLTGLCNSMWHGVRVIGPGAGIKRINNNSETDNNYGFFHIGTNSTIKHALIGVANAEWNMIEMDDLMVEIYDNINDFSNVDNLTLNNGQNTEVNMLTSGGVCEVERHVSFIDCFQGVNLGLYNNIAAPNGDIDRIGNATFEAEFYLPYPFSFFGFEDYIFTETGVELFGYSHLELEDNKFIHTKYGVRGISSKDIHLLGDNDGINVNFFDNCETGISFKDNLNSMINDPYNIIDGNEFENCKTGIQASGEMVKIRNNTLNQVGGNINLFGTYGIFLSGCEFEVTDANTIDNHYAGTVLISHPERGNNPVRNNVYHNNIVSIWTLGDNEAVEVTCNDFHDYEVAIAHQDYSFGGVPLLGLFDDQGKCQGEEDIPESPADNIFEYDESPDYGDIFSTIDDEYVYSHRNVPNHNPNVNNADLVVKNECIGSPLNPLPNYEDNCDIQKLLEDSEILNLSNEKFKNKAAKEKVKYYVEINSTDQAVFLLENLQTTMADKWLLPFYIDHNNFTAAQQILNNLPTHSLNDQQFKEVYSIYLASKQENRSWYQLTYVEKQTIREIAETYTQMGFEAQNLLSFLEGTYYPTPLPPFPVGNHGGNNKKAVENAELLLYPNPAKNTFTIQYSIEAQEKATFLLYEANGKMIFSQSFTENEYRNIDVSKIPTGVYYYQFFVDDKLIGVDKLLIVQ